MKGFISAATAILLLLVVSVPLEAGNTDLTFSGQIRNQGFVEKLSFDQDAEFMNYDLLRTRFNIQAVVDNNVTVFVQAQDSRTFGVGGFSGTTNDAKNLDLHQAYFSIANLFGEGWGAQAGRFEFVKGNHRMFGNVGWSNVGRAWEGGMLWYTQPKFTITAFGFKKVERDPISTGVTFTDDEDADVVGLYGELAELNLDLFVVGDIDARDVYALNETGTDSTVEKAMERVTIGMYYHRMHNQIDFEMNAAFQLGNYVDYGASLSGMQYDYGGMMFGFEAGYNLADNRNTRLALGMDFTSGDKDGTDDKDKMFYNLYWTGHKFNGYMDYFTGGSPNGLMDIFAKAKTDIISGWDVALDVHLFSAAQDYVVMIGSETTATKDIGTEFDLTVSTNRVAGVGLQFGASYFMAKDNYAGATENDPGFWSYSMATVNF